MSFGPYNGMPARTTRAGGRGQAGFRETRMNGVRHSASERFRAWLAHLRRQSGVC